MEAVTSALSETRALEGFLATLMLAIGIIFMAPGETFSLPHYSVLSRWAGEEAIGIGLLVIGVVRWVAIWINGHYRKTAPLTPLLRIAGCCLGSGFWAGSAVAFLESHWVAIPAMFAVCTLSLFAEILSGARCGVDAFKHDSFGERRRARLASGTR